jgi:putative toxin-antitoxin system antitoxin component (TIGR02293 family)
LPKLPGINHLEAVRALEKAGFAVLRQGKPANIAAKAIQVFGSEKEAERWLSEPAMALDRRRPVDLLDSSTGIDLVEQLLGRLEYGVYT